MAVSSSTMIGNETNRWDFDEVSGNILDKVSTADSTTVTGGTYNGDSWSADGVNDDIYWNVSPWQPIADVSGYVKFRWDDDTNSATVLYILGGAWNTRFFYQGSVPKINIDLYASAGGNFNINLSRELNNTETIVIAWSLDHSTREAHVQLMSDDATDPLTAWGSFTEDSETTTDDNGFLASDNGATTTAITFFQMGVQTGDVVTHTGLYQTCLDLLSGTALITDNLIRYYDLDETSGTTITDQGSDGSDITLSGTTADVITGTGQVGTALTTDGVNDAMTNGALSTVNVGMTQDMTVSFWYENVTPAGGDILFMAALSDNDNGIKIRYESAAFLTCAFEIAGTFSGNRIINNAWTVDGVKHHVMITYNAATGTVTTYHDNVASDAGGNGGGLGGASVTGLSIGCNPNSGENSNVLMDEVCVWNRVLTADEITLAYNLGDAGVEITGTLPDDSTGKIIDPLVTVLTPVVTPRITA